MNILYNRVILFIQGNKLDFIKITKYLLTKIGMNIFYLT